MRNILAIGSFLALLAGSLSAQSPEYYEFEEYDADGSVETEPTPTVDQPVASSVLCFPPIPFESTTGLRMIFSYNMTYAQNGYITTGMNPSLWRETDSIVFELKLPGQQEWKKVHAITRSNADAFGNSNDYKKKTLNIRESFPGEAFRLRIRYVTSFEEYPALSFKYFDLFAIPDCDYPVLVEVLDSTIQGDKATVRWFGGESNESAWNLEYAMRGEESWGGWQSAGQVEGASYQMEGLKTNQEYKVRMQAVCGVGKVSEWVESESFASGWTPAFIEDFNHLDLLDIDYYDRYALPGQWGIWLNDELRLPDSVSLSAMGSYQSIIYYWKGEIVDRIVSDSVNSAIGIMGESGGFHLLRLPALEIRSEESPSLFFDVAYGQIAEGDFQTVDAASSGYDKLYLWVSTDEGETFVMDSAVEVWDYSELAAMGDSARVEWDLSGYDGKVRVAIGYYAYESQQYLWLDNIGVVYGCPTAKFISKSGLTETSVTLEWWDDPTHGQWQLICQSEEEISQQEVSGSRIVLEDLLPATSYTVKVGQPCADTSCWSRISFKTGGVPCSEVSDVQVAEITSNAALVSWKGEASRYRLRIRPAGEAGTGYYYYETDAASYRLTNLLPETLYEGGIQSVCGQAAGDTSMYVPFDEFKTSDISCFTPENVIVKEVDHKSALVAWEGEAAMYQLEYRKEGEYVGQGLFSSPEESFRIEGLTAENRYEVRVRSVCGAGDTSDWSLYVPFVTLQAPACPEPVDLRAESITATSANLKWGSPEEGASFTLRYSLASPVSWDSVSVMTDTVFLLEDLQPETVYLWSVMSSCLGGNHSGWASRQNFETSPVANEGDDFQGLHVYATPGQLHLLNPAALPVDRVWIYGTDGHLHGCYQVGSTENVLIRTELSMQVAIVLVESQGRMCRFKVWIY